MVIIDIGDEISSPMLAMKMGEKWNRYEYVDDAIDVGNRDAALFLIRMGIPIRDQIYVRSWLIGDTMEVQTDSSITERKHGSMRWVIVLSGITIVIAVIAVIIISITVGLNT